jgi:hypothetical protein
MTDEARAVAEIAKSTGEIVKAAGGIGGYLARVFGSVPDNLVGLGVGDWLDHRRRRHLAELEANTTRHLEGIAADRLTEPSPNVLLSLMQAAVDEGRPELQALWSALLANAMVDGGRKVRRVYFEAVRQMDPVDVLTLDILRRRLNPHTREATAMRADLDFFEQERQKLSIPRNEWDISLGRLIRLDFIVNPGFPLSRDFAPDLTAVGHGFLAACQVP